MLDRDLAATCGLIALELLSGAISEKEFARLQMRLRGLRWLPIEKDDWESAARLGFSLRRVGTTVPFADVLLSALAMHHDAVLLHADRAFDFIVSHTALQVESLVSDTVTLPVPNMGTRSHALS